MNKIEFLTKLKKGIKSLPLEEQESAMEYYEEYFAEAESDEIAIAKLPHPKHIASKLVLEFGNKKPKSVSTWAIVLAVLSAPVSIPLALSLILCIIVLIPVIMAVLLVPAAAGVSLVVCGIFAIIILIPAFATNFATGFVYLGLLLFCAGGGYLLIRFTILLFQWIAKLIKLIALKLSERRYSHEG